MIPATRDDYIQQELKERFDHIIKAKSNIVDFVRFMKDSREKDFFFDPVIAHHLAVYEALQGLADDEYDNLMILMPPGAGKSVLCTVQFPLFFWNQNPMMNILCASNTQDLAEEFSRRRRGACLTETFQEVSGFKLTKENLNLLENDTGGTMSAHGVGGAIVGRRSNLNLLDDPVLGSEQAASDSQLEKMMVWYDQDFRSRLVKGGKELIVTTRWSRRDIAGRLIERAEKGEEEWKIVRLPLICDDPENDPVNRKMGEVLWPEEFTDKRVRHAQRDDLIFQTMYQQLPYISDGDWMGESHLHQKSGTPDLSKMRIIIGGDLALTQGGNADYTVFAVCGLHESGQMHVLHIERGRNAPNVSVQVLFKLLEIYPQAQELLLDDDPASKVFKELLLAELKHSPRPIHIVPVMMPMKGLDKESRAVPLRGLFHQDRVIIWKKEWTPVFIKEVMGFPDGVKHDDMVDAVGLVAKRAVKLATFRSKENTYKDPFENTLMTNKTDSRGRAISNLTLAHLHEDNQSKTLSLSRRRI